MARCTASLAPITGSWSGGEVGSWGWPCSCCSCCCAEGGSGGRRSGELIEDAPLLLGSGGGDSSASARGEPVGRGVPSRLLPLMG